MPGNDSNKSIIEGCVKNDRKAQERLYRLFLGPMWHICRRYIDNPEEALEVMHNGFLKVYQNIQAHDDQLASLYTWMSRIMVNTCIDFFRNKKKLLFINAHEVTEYGEPSIDVLSEKYSLDDLFFIVNQLPETTRTIFNLYELEGYGHKEIATMLCISPSTSRWHLAEAKKRLREILKKWVKEQITKT